MSDFSYRLSATDKDGNPVDIRVTPLSGFGFDAGGWYDINPAGVKTYRVKRQRNRVKRRRR